MFDKFNVDIFMRRAQPPGKSAVPTEEDPNKGIRKDSALKVRIFASQESHNFPRSACGSIAEDRGDYHVHRDNCQQVLPIFAETTNP